jgi:hypothetical protein
VATVHVEAEAGAELESKEEEEKEEEKEEEELDARPADSLNGVLSPVRRVQDKECKETCAGGARAGCCSNVDDCESANSELAAQSAASDDTWWRMAPAS